MRLSDAWRAWAAENLAAGMQRHAVIAGLIEGGVASDLAAREVMDIARSPLLGALRVTARRAKQLELIARLSKTHLAFAPKPLIGRREMPAPRVFYDRYFAASRPVVVTGALERWPALERWSLAQFEKDLGDEIVGVTDGRSNDPDYDVNFNAHAREMRLGELIARCRGGAYTNDVYMVARNATMQRPAFQRLLDDVVLDPGVFVPERLSRACSLWIGPAGTVTPLHHDTTNIFFTQIEGRKRFTLASPFEIDLLDHARGFYAGAPSDHPDVTFHAVEIGPGEALFLPAGWWHHVEALDASLSFSVMCFRRENNFPWYLPGHDT